MAISGTEGTLLLVARILFGGVIAFMGLNHFMQVDEMTEYAGYKGLPAPKVAVLASGVVLVLGGLAVVAGAFPVAGALAIAAFLVVAAVTMHDFWAAPVDDQEDELIQFLKNVVMAGGALAIAVLGWQEWAYSVGMSFF